MTRAPSACGRSASRRVPTRWSTTGTSSGSSSIPGPACPVETEKTNVCKGCFFINDSPEISKDEAQALIDSHEYIADGLYVVVQGLAPSDLNITTANPDACPG